MSAETQDRDSAAAVVEIADLVKTFGAVRALDGFELRVAPGEVHGFLGPNGAGKSTTIRILLGLVRATAGTATVLGADPWRDAATVHRRIATVPGDVSLWPGLTGGEAIDVLLRLRGFDPAATRRDELVARFDLDPRRRCRTYSKGNRQKVALIAAFAAPAELHLLDEPTSGLDPLMEHVFADEIRRIRAAGGTVLLSSHRLDEVEALCDRVTIIRAGQRVAHGSLADLRHLARTRVSYRGTPLTDLRIADLTEVAGRVSFTVAADDMPAILAQLATAAVEQLTLAPPSLEELFLQHYDLAPR